MKLSISRLPLLAACQYFARDDVEHVESPPSDDATFGTAGHALCARYIEGANVDPFSVAEEYGLGNADADMLSAAWAHAKTWIDKNRRPSWLAEARVAYQVATDTGRILERSERHRDYADIGPGVLPGTADIVDRAPRHVTIGDWKFSRGLSASPTATHRDLQLHGYGLAVARAENAERATLLKLRVTQDALFEEGHTLDDFELDAAATQIRGLIDRVPGAEPKPGVHCGELWCPARATCPAVHDGMGQIIPAGALTRRMRLSLDVESDEHAEWMLGVLAGMPEAIDAIEQRIREYADRRGGIRLSDGRIYRKAYVRKEKVNLSAAGAVDALRRLGAEEAITVKRSVTWDAIKRIGGRDLERRAREELRAIGATQDSGYETYEAKAPKAGNEAAQRGG